MNNAVRSYSTIASNYATNAGLGNSAFMHNYTEKLAELIVRECARIALDSSNSTLPANAIKQHFGVE